MRAIVPGDDSSPETFGQTETQKVGWAGIQPVWRKVEVSSYFCAGLGEGFREWIRGFNGRSPLKGQHIDVLGSSLYETQGFEGRTSDHNELKPYVDEPKLLLQRMEELVEIVGS